MNLFAGGATGAGAEGAATESFPPMSSRSSSCSAAFAVATGAGAGLTESTSDLVGTGVVGTARTAGASGLVAGAGLAATVVAGEVAIAPAPGFSGSPLRGSPRATRNGPLACSMLMGLVRTRLAPIRNPFATPGRPSTTATARDPWLHV